MKLKRNKTCMSTHDIRRMTAAAEDIMAYAPEGFIKEFDLLCVALLLSDPSEVKQFLARCDRSDAHYIAGEVEALLEDPKVFAKSVADGFFAYEIDRLLEIAKRDRIAGARFIPIFFSALLNARELALSDEQLEALKQHIEEQKKLDGFVILSATDQKFALSHSNEVVPI